MTEEIWKDIPCHIGYQASSLGRIRSLDRKRFIKKRGGHWATYRGQMLSPSTNKNGYLKVKLGAGTSYTVHRLVALAFLLNPGNKPQINHKDGDKTNNVPANLEWCTCQHNLQHAFLSGLKPGYPNERHPMCRLSNDRIKEIRRMDFSKRGTKRQFALANGISVSHLGGIVNGTARRGIA